ncbi:MAG: hypothetical protein HY760_02020 [Nitrospirae bacterium]|nr:hypothetical protein [Nitrospirota bacterium]
MNKPDKPDEEKPVPPLYVSTDEEIPEEGRSRTGQKPAFGESIIWILFGLGVLLAVYISYFGMKPAPPRSDSVSRTDGSPTSREVSNKIIEKEWARPSGTLRFRMLLTPALAEIKYHQDGPSPMEVRFLSLEIQSERGYKEIIREDGSWETLEPGRAATRQYTLAGSSTRSALLTLEVKDGGKIVKVGIPFD